MHNESETKALMKKESDLEQMKLVVDQLAEVLEIYTYLEDEVIRDVRVSVNVTKDSGSEKKYDFEFDLEGEFLEKSMKGLKAQLKVKAEMLRAQVKLM